MTELTRVGDFSLTWGESLRWDDRRQRLYFVDCAAQTLHWLDGAEPPLHTLRLASMAAGLVLTETDVLVACLGDGLHVVDPDAGTSELLAPYPEGWPGGPTTPTPTARATSSPARSTWARATGSTWWFSATEGWRQLDPDFSNTNGPVVLDVDGQSTLVVGDTPAQAVLRLRLRRRRRHDRRASGVRRPRRPRRHARRRRRRRRGRGVELRARARPARPLHRRRARPHRRGAGVEPERRGLRRADLDRLYIVSIALDLGRGEPGEQAGWLHAIDGLGVAGRPEARFQLG